MKKILYSPIHIFLLPVFPLLSIISNNINSLFVFQVFKFISYILVPAIILWILIDLIFMKNIRKSALVISLPFFVLKPFASVDFLSETFQLKQFVEAHYSRMILLLVSIILSAMIIKLLKINLKKITFLFNIFGVSFVFIPACIILYSLSIRVLYPILLFHPILYEQKGVKISTAPDIYYIIPDRYANEQTLSDYYQFDNTKFYNALRSRGFYIANKSAANYPFTEPSLASSLNMNYFDVKNENLYSNDTTPLLYVLENNEVVRYLKSRGYIFYYFGAEWVTSNNKNADFSYKYVPKKGYQVQTLLYQLSVNHNALGKYIYDNDYSVTANLLTKPLNHGNYMIDQMLSLSQIISNPGPKFVFVHSLLTHDPYVFDKNGVFTDRTATNVRNDTKALYLGQLEFANKILLHTVDTIIQNSSKPPIIILQSDEGPYPRRFRANLNNFDWHSATAQELQQKIRILNAYYLPGKSTGVPYSNISPVNSFRLLCNLYLGEHLPLLPDKNYAPISPTSIYDFFDVTEKVK
jgi:hypothetical protein